nr:F36 [uncultured bacterium]
MSKNIVIYSDGTGQRGGILFDEPRSNIFKLFRGTRCGPDSAVNPAEQITFYDPGIGTKVPGAGFFLSVWNRVLNTFSQAMGLGLTGNIVDCYAALVRHWRPGDHIFLFGFSRGAYTVRCLGGVIALCGIPTTLEDGTPLTVDKKTARRIAKEAVKRAYQHTHSRPRKAADTRQIELLDQRDELARRFRAKYGAGTASGPNAYPHFIGVFDTVAALSSPKAIMILGGVGLAMTAAIATACSVFLPASAILDNWFFGAGIALAAILSLAFIIAFVGNFVSRMRSEIGLPHSKWWRPFHLLDMRMKFYDTGLNINVGYARHALAIDERRKAFDRVPWGTPGVWPERPKDAPAWFEQLWFAGCHSDIGGSYPEEESRLSDISLHWMLEAAHSVGLKYDPSVLKLYPDATGPQHDETEGFPFKWAKKINRVILPEAPLHPSVAERLRANEVLQYNIYKPYRPASLQQRRFLGGNSCT